MRILKTVSLALLLLPVSGCITFAAIDAAKGQTRDENGHVIVNHDDNGNVIVNQPHPGNYWFIPLTVPADIATSPFQLIYVALTDDAFWDSLPTLGAGLK